MPRKRAFRAPVRAMQARSAPILFNPRSVPSVSPISAAEDLVAAKQALEQAEKQRAKEFQQNEARRQEEHAARMRELDGLINSGRLRLAAIRGPKGDQGVQGEAGKDADEQRIIDAVSEKLSSEFEGKLPTIEAIAQAVLEVMPAPVDGKDADEEKIIEQVLQHFADKSLIKIEHISGLANELEKIRKEIKTNGGRGYVHGGGITALYAGSNITLQRRTDGNYTISSAASGFTELTATGVINGTNKAYTFTQKPTYIVSDGAFMKENKGWTWNGATLTATMDVAPALDIYGIA